MKIAKLEMVFLPRVGGLKLRSPSHRWKPSLSLSSSCYGTKPTLFTSLMSHLARLSKQQIRTFRRWVDIRNNLPW